MILRYGLGSSGSQNDSGELHNKPFGSISIRYLFISCKGINMNCTKTILYPEEALVLQWMDLNSTTPCSFIRVAVDGS